MKAKVEFTRDEIRLLEQFINEFTLGKRTSDSDFITLATIKSKLQKSLRD